MEIEKTIYANILLYEIYNQNKKTHINTNSNSLILSSYEKTTIFSNPNILKEGLEELILKGKYDIEICTNMPSTLKYINMGNLYNKMIPINLFPLNLIKLSFGKCFNQEFDILPPKLQILELGHSYNKKFKHNVLPQTLTHLSFSKNSLYNQPFEENVLPKSLQYLSFNGHFFDTDFEYELCYQDLCILQDDSTNDFNQIINENVLPQSLIYLKFSNRFNHKIDKNVLPKRLKYLIFGTWYNTEIDIDVLPNSIEFLKFDTQFNKKINTLPLSLKTLIFGKMFNQPINIGLLPNGLETLSFNTFFNQDLEAGTLPKSVKYLYFGLKFNKSLKKDVLPSNLLHLQICNIPYNDINFILPQKLISVTISITISKHNDIFNLVPNLLYLKVYTTFDRFQCTYYINFPNNSLPMEIYGKKVSILESKKLNNCAKELINNISNNLKGNVILEELVKHTMHPSKIIKILSEKRDACNIENYI